MQGLLHVTADWLDEIRRQALRQGLKALDQYDLIQSRLRRVALSSSTAEVATSELHRLLMQVAGRPAAPSSSVCSEQARLIGSIRLVSQEWKVSLRQATNRWLSACCDQSGFLIMLLREAAAKRKAEREELEEIDAAGLEAEAQIKAGALNVEESTHE
jgi:hypothetical protein